MPNSAVTPYLTSTQIGEIAVDLTTSHLVLDSRGRLSPFKPIADDQGIDLIIYDKHTELSVPVQVKSRTTALYKKNGARGNIVHFELRKSTFKETPDAFLLAIYFQPFSDDIKIKRTWLIPMNKIPSVSTKGSTEKGTKYVMRPSRDMKSNDQFTPYRWPGMRQVADDMIAYFDRKSNGE